MHRFPQTVTYFKGYELHTGSPGVSAEASGEHTLSSCPAPVPRVPSDSPGPLIPSLSYNDREEPHKGHPLLLPHPGHLTKRAQPQEGRRGDSRLQPTAGTPVSKGPDMPRSSEQLQARLRGQTRGQSRSESPKTKWEEVMGH